MQPPTAKLRWGILGVAHNNKRVLPAFAQAAHAELRAIASRSLERAQAAAAAAGIPTAYGSYERLLDDPAIDAIYNPLPNSLHAEWTMKAAERGKHVLCEKPLAPTAAEAQKVVDFCRAKGVRLMDGFAWPHHPRTRSAAAIAGRPQPRRHTARDRGVYLSLETARPGQHSDAAGTRRRQSARCRLLPRLRPSAGRSPRSRSAFTPPLLFSMAWTRR